MEYEVIYGEVGSIPAWAGQPTCARTPTGTGTVYPRVGGATAIGIPAGQSRLVKFDMKSIANVDNAPG